MANSIYVSSLHERVAVLETKLAKLEDIETKLDQLLELKAKGVGALWFVSIIVGSGLLGLVATIAAFFNGRHL